MTFEKTVKWLKDKDLFDELKNVVSIGKRKLFDRMIDLACSHDEFADTYVEELDKIGHDLLWEAVLAEVGEQETAEDKIRRLEEEIKVLKERKEDDLK